MPIDENIERTPGSQAMQDLTIQRGDQNYDYRLAAVVDSDGGLVLPILGLMEIINQTPGLMSEKNLVIRGLHNAVSVDQPTPEPSAKLYIADRRIYLNDTERLLFVDNRNGIELSHSEYAVLKALGLNVDKVLTKAHLQNILHEGSKTPNSNSLEVLISKLRAKFGPELHQAIKTRRSIGYMAVSHLDTTPKSKNLSTGL